MLHRLHAALRRGLHDRVDLLDLALADEVPDGVVREEDLEARDAAEPVGGRQEGLRDDALERVRELHAHLLLLRRREDVDDAVDRARRALRVQRREDEVAGLGGGERGRDRLEVAHLAEEDHVGVLAQRGAKRLAERRRVGADLALRDDAALVPVHELDRVLDGEDVVRLRAVDLVDHRGERRRLARARRAGDEHEAARLHRELAERRRQPELLERPELLRDVPERGGERVALEVDVHAEAREAGNAVREVELPVHLELLLLLGGEDAVEEVARVLRHDLLRRRAATRSPWTRTVGGAPGTRWRSDAPASVARLEQIVDGGRRRVHGHLAYRQRPRRA